MFEPRYQCSNPKNYMRLSGRKLSKKMPKLGHILGVYIFGSFRRYLGLMNLDLFLYCFVETVVQMCFF